MNKFDISDMQSISLDILKYLKTICDENGLTYFLAYGTLLGAVRHKDFIPWDDDIDVLIPREDYIKLIEIMSKNPHEFYKLVSIETETKYTAPLPKIIDNRTILKQDYGLIEKVPLGVYIDLFILDGMGNDYEKAIDHYSRGVEILNKWMKADTKLFPNRAKKGLKDVYRWLRNLPYKIKGIKYYLKKLEKQCLCYEYEKSEYVATMSLPSSYGPKRNVHCKEDFGAGVDIQFEDGYFRVPLNYDTILKKWYGEYMMLPPVEKRESHHEYVAYWKGK